MYNKLLRVLVLINLFDFRNQPAHSNLIQSSLRRSSEHIAHMWIEIGWRWFPLFLHFRYEDCAQNLMGIINIYSNYTVTARLHRIMHLSFLPRCPRVCTTRITFAIQLQQQQQHTFTVSHNSLLIPKSDWVFYFWMKYYKTHECVRVYFAYSLHVCLNVVVDYCHKTDEVFSDLMVIL